MYIVSKDLQSKPVIHMSTTIAILKLEFSSLNKVAKSSFSASLKASNNFGSSFGFRVATSLIISTGLSLFNSSYERVDSSS